MSRAARPLLHLGLVAIVLGLTKIHAAQIADPPYDFTLQSTQVRWTVAFIALLLVAAYSAGLPDVPRTLRAALASALVAPLAAAAAISLAQLLTGSPLLPRFVVFGSVLFAVAWGLVCCHAASEGRLRDEARARAFVVGDEDDVLTLASELARGAERPATIVGSLRPSDAAALGTSRPLVEGVIRSAANVVVLNRAAANDDSVVGQAASLHGIGLRIRTLTLFYEQWLGKLPIHELERVSMLFDIGELHRSRYGRLKRVLDVAAGSVAVVLLTVCLPFVLMGNAIGNRGPLFFHQERVGKNGRTFTMLKFRTMCPSEHRADWTSADDPRVTSFGGFLRRTHLDELPQAINMLRGDLSIVGPRPEQARYVAELREKLAFYDFRHMIRPGLTGWAQVKYPYASSEEDALEKLQYEFFYLRHQNLSLDLRIIARTLRSVVGAEGR